MKYGTAVKPGYGGMVQRWLLVLMALMAFIVAEPAMAKRVNGGLAGGVLVPPAGVANPAMPNQFDLVGYLETATVDGTICPNIADPRLWGGKARINGQEIIIPCNTILQMPAFATSWADLFTLAPKDIMPPGSTESGLALGDTMINGAAGGLLNMTWTAPAGAPTTYNAALPAHEFHVVGNVINGQNIAGLVFISQQSLNGGQGVISCIDYATGELQVGGKIQPHGMAPCPAPDGTFTRVRMNDPVGRFGIAHGGPNSVPGTVDVIEPGYDPRFTADTDNPTMKSALGYPICISAFNPFNTTLDPLTGATLPAAIDGKCPIYNRPVAPNCKSFDPATLLPAFGAQPAGTYCNIWVMDAPGAHAADAAATDPTLAAPLVIGDTINFHGTMKADANGPYISAHSIEANLGIYTQPHTPPSYVMMEALIVGTGGGTVGGVAVESTAKVAWTGFTTDPTELVDFYSLHQDPATGKATAFLQGTYDPCCVPLGRFRSPVNNIGVFGEPQRNYRAISRTACQPAPVPGSPNPANTPQLLHLCTYDDLVTPDPTAQKVLAPVTNGNGLVTSQYTLPNFEFIFGENLAIGGPIIPANLQDLPFLFCGSGPLDGPNAVPGSSPIVGQLFPTPWALPMADPAFHATLCPSVAAVGAAAGGVVTPPPAPLPAVINSVTAITAPAAFSNTTATPVTVTLTVNATNPNSPTNANLGYSWAVTGAKAGTVTLSCGTCSPLNANLQTITATFTPSLVGAGPLVFTATVSNGVPPSVTGTASLAIPVVAVGVKAPTVTKFAVPGGTLTSGQVVTLSATAQSSPAGRAMTVSFAQTPTAGVPTVTLGPVTKDAAGTTFTTSFVVPFSATPVNGLSFNFTATATDTLAALVSKPQTASIKANITKDAVAVTTAAYRQIVSRVGAPAEFGKFNIAATSTATSILPAQPMTMKATLSANAANGTPLPPVTIDLLLTPADLPGTPAPVCGATPCWIGATNGIIVDTTQTPAVLAAPSSIVVTSSLGGTTTILTGNPVYTIR